MMENDKIDEKLRKLLENSSGSEPFRVPDGYFERFPDQIQSMVQNLPDFETVSPVQPFSVPDGYFEKLPQEINNIILSEEKRKFSWKSLLQNILRPVTLVPAFLLVLVVLSSYLFFTRTTVIDLTAHAQNESDELNPAMVIQQLDESTLIQVLAEENDNESSATEQSYEDYLIDNDIDISQIEKKL